MLDEKSLDLLNSIQNKILLQSPADTWTTDMRDMRKTAMREQASLRTSKHLNSETFYQKYSFKNKWIRLDESIEEIKTMRKL